MKSILYHFWLLLLVAFSSNWLNAQQLINVPYPSPKAVATQTVGMTDISITYYRPAVKERKVWGELVAYDAVWRAGANDNTVIEFSGDVKVEGEDLSAGLYGLHVIPSEKKATIIFSKNTTAWGSFSYNPKEDALRVEVETKSAGHHYEHLTFDYEELTTGSAVCVLKWGDRKIPFKVEVDVHNDVVANMRKQLQNKPGFTWQGWNEAAAYCLRNDVNQQEALQWAGRSVFMNPTPQNIITKARLTGKVKAAGAEDKELEYALTSLGNDLTSLPCTWKEWNAAASFASNNKSYDKAVEWVSQSVKMSPNMTNMMAQSDIMVAKGDAKGAEKIKKEALARGSNGELNNYGYKLLFNGQAAEAVEVFEANVKNNPEDPNAWDSLGEGYVTAGQNDKAIKAFKKSLSMNPPDNVRANSIKLLKQLGVEYSAEKIKP